MNTYQIKAFKAFKHFSFNRTMLTSKKTMKKKNASLKTAKVAASSLQRKLNVRYKRLIFCFFSVFVKLLSCEATCVIKFFSISHSGMIPQICLDFRICCNDVFRVFNFLQKQILSGFFKNFQGSHLQIHLTLVLF